MAATFRQIAEDLGGSAVLGCDVHNEMIMVELIQGGLPVETTQHALIAQILSLEELRELVIPTTTLTRRRKEGRLDAEESDKLVRLTRMVELARTALGAGKGDMWLRRPNRALEGKVPLALCRSEAGARLVEGVLGRIQHGGIS